MYRVIEKLVALNKREGVPLVGAMLACDPG